MKTLKTCKSCKILLSLSCFNKNKGGLLGLRARCILCEKSRKANFYSQNRLKILANKKTYQTINAESRKAYSYAYCKNRLKNDKLYKLKINIASLIRNSIKSKTTKRALKTIDLLGCSVECFKQHIESSFSPDMNWNNYGSYWSIDHICPCDQAQTAAEIIKLQHYSNLRPMTVTDNIVKSNKATTEATFKCQELLNRAWIE